MFRFYYVLLTSMRPHGISRTSFLDYTRDLRK